MNPTREEILYTCPRCGRTGFLKLGLTRHRCDGPRANPQYDCFGQVVRTPLTAAEVAAALARPNIQRTLPL